MSQRNELEDLKPPHAKKQRIEQETIHEEKIERSTTVTEISSENAEKNEKVASQMELLPAVSVKELASVTDKNQAPVNTDPPEVTAVADKGLTELRSVADEMKAVEKDSSEVKDINKAVEDENEVVNSAPITTDPVEVDEPMESKSGTENEGSSVMEGGTCLLFSPEGTAEERMLSTQMNLQIERVETFLKMDRLRRQKHTHKKN